MRFTRLSISLLVALGLHVLALFGLLNNPMDIQLDSQKQGSLFVVVDVKQIQKAHVVRPQPKAEKSVPVKPKRIFKEVSNEAASREEKLAPPSVTTVQTVEPDSHLAELKEAYLQDLFQAIAQQQHYPASAQRRGQEGRVLTAFSVLADGHFANIDIAESSGYRELDKAALQAVKRASGFAPLPKDLLNESWSIHAPMAFRLNDG